MAFSYLSGIDDSNDRQMERAELWRFRDLEKLTARRQDSLKDRLFDSNNPVGAMSIGNTEFLWNMPGVSNRQEQRQQAPNIPQMEQKYLQDQDNKAQLPQFPDP